MITIQSVRLKWPIAANYRRLNRFSSNSTPPPPPYLAAVIYPYNSRRPLRCSLCVAFTILYQYILWWWPIIKRANEPPKLLFLARCVSQFKVKLPIIYGARAHNLTVCSQPVLCIRDCVSRRISNTEDN